MRRIEYLICATPRCGSTLLCEALSSTGRAGRPAEYFEGLIGTNAPRQPRQYFKYISPELDALLPQTAPHPTPELARARNYGEYLDWVFEQGTTPNGVFGAKVMWGHVPDLAIRLRTWSGSPAATEADAIRAAFPTARFVWITRTNRVAQAVSLWKAIQTQQWRRPASRSGTARGRLAYEESAIRQLVEQLREQEECWSRFFGEIGVHPLVLRYEALASDLTAAVAAVLRHIGVPERAGLRIDPPLRRQADVRSRRWVERFTRASSESSAPEAGSRTTL